ncbi:MAG: pilus assembly protein [Actinomycetota bacterium]|nr:pilus assembly protein [Actinomycetota bacterium]
MSDRRGQRGDSGLSLLEFVLVLPFVLLIVFGTIEGGAAFVAGDRVAGAAAQAARIGAAGGSRAEADRDLLVALRATLPPGELTRLDRVVVFKPAGADGSIPDGCIKGRGDVSEQGTASCNSYTGDTVRNVTAGSMLGFGGTSGTKDRWWPPALRRDTLSQDPDYLGVWVRTVHHGVLGVVFRDVAVTRTSIVRIQPDLAG